MGPVIGTFVGSVNGGEVHAIVALGGDSYQTTLLWHDPLGAPHAATVDSGSDSEEEVDLDEDGEPDVMIRPGGCSPESNAGEAAGDGSSVCVYLRQDSPNESDEQ